jgi:hypothetical protein
LVSSDPFPVSTLVSQRFACHDSFHQYAMSVAEFDIQLDFFDRLMPASIEQLRQMLVDRSLMIKQVMERQVDHELEAMHVKTLLLTQLKGAISNVQREEERALLQQQRSVDFWTTKRTQRHVERNSERAGTRARHDEAETASSASSGSGCGSVGSLPRGACMSIGAMSLAASPARRVSTLPTTVEIEDEAYWEAELDTRSRERSRAHHAPRPAPHTPTQGHARRAHERHPSDARHVRTHTQSDAGTETSIAAAAAAAAAALPDPSYALSLWCSSGDSPTSPGFTLVFTTPTL